MEDDDDIYEPEESSPNDTSNESLEQAHAKEVKMADARLEDEEENYDDEDEDEEEDTESDIEFIVEKKDAPIKDESLVATFERPKATPIRITADPSAKTPTPETNKAHLKPGSEYPAHHTSTLDINADPIHPSTGKPITQTDLDIDFPDNDKPWRRPGSDITDYYNYGFDEFTWASYCLKQNSLRKEVGDQKKEMEDMQNFFSGGGGAPGMPPMPGMPGPPGGGAAAAGGAMGGLPELSPDMMGNMMATMMSQGLDPASMPPEDFMRYAQQYMQMGGQGGGGQQGFGGQMGGQGNQQQAGGYGDGGGGGGGFQGQGQNQGGGQQRGGRGRGRRWQ